MATGFNTQIIDGRFHLQFETDKRECYEYVQAAARDCLDGKATDKCHRWINVEERMPEKEVAVIAYCKEDGHSWYAFRRGGGWWRPGDRISIKIFGTVTHWMPLPEPPEVNKP